jgi:hypothetical protein
MNRESLDFFSPALLVPISFALLCWLTVYVLIIRKGLVERTYAMPLLPLCVNVSYEFFFGFIRPDAPPINSVNISWFLFDLGIVFAYLRFGAKEFPSVLPRSWFLPSFVAVLALAFAGVVAVAYEFKDWTGSYTGWGANTLMSAAYIALLLRRGSTAGQSMYIGLFRLIGSVALIPVELRISPNSVLLPFFYVAFVLLDLTYLRLLHVQFVREGKKPWRVV